jgi:hypothetical protein
LVGIKYQHQESVRLETFETWRRSDQSDESDQSDLNDPRIIGTKSTEDAEIEQVAPWKVLVCRDFICQCSLPLTLK